MKTILALIVAALTLASIPNKAQASDSGVVRIFSGGNTIIPAGSTNRVIINGTTNYFGIQGTPTNLFYSVDEFDNIGFTESWTGDANTTNAPVGVLITRTFDGGVIFDPQPNWSFTNVPVIPGATTFTYTTNLDTKGVTHLSFQLINNSGGKASNVVLELNKKSPKFGARPPGGK